MEEVGNQGCDDHACKYVLEPIALPGSRTRMAQKQADMHENAILEPLVKQWGGGGNGGPWVG